MLNNKMDPRCPRKLEDFPDTWCPLAVQRLKAIRHAGKELTEEEEAKLPGCPWAVNNQVASYCFFKMIGEGMPDTRMFSDNEIARFCSVSIETVKKVEKVAIDKIKNSESFSEISELYGSDKILDEKEEDLV